MAEHQWIRYSRYVAERATLLMHRKKMTQSSLADRMGRTQQYVSHILGGRENLTLETISKLEDALETDLMRGMFFDAALSSPGENLLKDEPPVAYSAGYASTLRTINSAETISCHFETGDKPFLLLCDDNVRYLCKASKYGTGANSLARELIGTVMSNMWGLSDLPLALVRILPHHSDGKVSDRNDSLPCLGRKWLDNAKEIEDMVHPFINADSETADRLLKIAIFDLWLSNEDRLNNNLNMLFSFDSGEIVAIDHAGIFNTSFSAPLLQLSTSDSMLYSQLLTDVTNGKTLQEKQIAQVEKFFHEKTELCRKSVDEIWRMIPKEWKINESDYHAIMDFIFSKRWIDGVTTNFREILSHCSL